MTKRSKAALQRKGKVEAPKPIEKVTLKFKCGDIVVLKSGSPEMTVGKVHASGVIECLYWIAASGAQVFATAQDAFKLAKKAS